LHYHSTWSERPHFLERDRAQGELLGASAVVMSEHDFDFTPTKWEDYIEACRAASTAKCVIIPGVEYSSPDADIHVVTVGASHFHGIARISWRPVVGPH
jgi:hypothetical protein